MIDPYQPDLGQAGIGDLVARVLENLEGYVLVHIPAGLSPWSGGALTALGLVLMATALAGPSLPTYVRHGTPKELE